MPHHINGGDMKEIETVLDHCKHPDCVYRLWLDKNTPCCYYAAMENEIRGCKISECTRYKRGKKSVRQTELYIVWDIYGLDNE